MAVAGLSALATNDDGIDSPGLRVLVEGLRGAGLRVIVAAPRGDMSGAGKGFRFPARVWEVDYPGAERAWTGETTPASLIYAYLRVPLGEPPSIVASGVNHGPNLGAEDMLTSATIGGALEAAFQGIPGLAVSFWRRSRGLGEEARLLEKVTGAAARALLRSGQRRVAIVVNIPREPVGVRVVRPAFSRYRVRVQVGRDGLLRPVMDESLLYNGDAGPGTDIYWYEKQHVTVLPLGVETPLCPGEDAWRAADMVASEIAGTL